MTSYAEVMSSSSVRGVLLSVNFNAAFTSAAKRLTDTFELH